jgi:hypothetical protein
MSKGDRSTSDAFSADDSDIHSALLAIPSMFERLIYIISLAKRKDDNETASARVRRLLVTEPRRFLRSGCD